MLRRIDINGTIITYSMQYKNVKNINLRIKSDGTVHVSANYFVSQKHIESFLGSKSDFIIGALNKIALKSKVKKTLYVSEGDIQKVILDFVKHSFLIFKIKELSTLR